jgi:putative transposase
VFLAPADYERYLELLGDYGERHGLTVLGWCLMANHVHLVVVPPGAEALGLALRAVHMRYAQAVNRRQGWVGHLWQNRFCSCPLDDAHCWTALRYVEQNPVRAGLVERAEDYPWSSAAAHCGLGPDRLASGDWWTRAPADWWRQELRRGVDDDVCGTLRARTASGRPCGDAAFLARAAAQVGRELPVRGPGRPRRKED